jgi:hypothetical protein
LGTLHVGVAGQIGVTVFVAQDHEDVNQIKDRGGNSLQGVQGEESKRRRYLVVATARRMKFRADVTGEFDDATFNGHMDVFVTGRTFEPIVGELRQDLTERGDQRRTLAITDKSGAHETLDVRLRPSDVKRIENVIEGVAL